MARDIADVTVTFVTGSGSPVGAGWLLRNGDVLTCAHVVEDAANGSCAPDTRVSLRMATAKPTDTHSYRVIACAPMKREDNQYFRDFALLSPSAPSVKLSPASSFLPGEPITGVSVAARGTPQQKPTGIGGFGDVGVKTTEERYEILNPPKRGDELDFGFSGAPLLAGDNIIGIYAAKDRKNDRGYLITARTLDAWLREQKQRPLWIAAPSKKRDAIRKRILGEHFQSGDFNLTAADAQAVVLEPSDVADMAAQDHTTIVLSGDGGSGKTHFLLAVIAELEALQISYVWLDLRELKLKKHPALQTLNRESHYDEDTVLSLIDDCFVEDGYREPDKPTVIIADGANELGASAAGVARALDTYVRKRGPWSLLISRRHATELSLKESPRALLARPLEKTEIKRVLGSATRSTQLHDDMWRVLSSPQLLSIYLTLNDVNVDTRNALFEKYFETVLTKIGADDAPAPPNEMLNVLGELAFRILRLPSAPLRVPPKTWDHLLQEVLDGTDFDLSAEFATKLTEDLVGHSVVLATPDSREFMHSLYAEWLTARHMLSGDDQRRWTNAAFTALTIEESSNDGIQLAMKMLTDANRVPFLKRMYDWRWNRVLDVVVEGAADKSPLFRDMVVAINALRRHDRFVHTREITDRIFKKGLEGQNEFLKKAAATKNERATVELMLERWRQSASDPLAKDFDALMALAENEGVNELERAKLLNSPDPFIGWAACNLMRINGLSIEDVDCVIGAYLASYSTADSLATDELPTDFNRMVAGTGLRWRLAHALGRSPPLERIDAASRFLLGIWTNETEYVDTRYGACRSLMELALVQPTARERIFDGIDLYLESWKDKGGASVAKRRDAVRSAEPLWRANRLATEEPEREHWRTRLAQSIGRALAAAELMNMRTEAALAALEELQR